MKNPIKMRTNLLVMLVTETFLFFSAVQPIRNILEGRKNR